MTAEQLSKMTDEEKRIAIAEARGWSKVRPWEADHELKRFAYSNRLPDYLKDLNECYEFEETISGVDYVLQRREYVKNLMSIVAVDPDMSRWSFIQDFLLLHATAGQRCDAFLLTLSDDQPTKTL